MGLYRQIAGIPDGNPAYIEQVSGVPILMPGTKNYTSIPIINDGITPVDYTTPIQTIQPSNPINISDTGGTTPFQDPREWNPIPQYKPPFPTIDLGPSTLQPTVTPSNPLPPDGGTTSTPLPADTKSAITNNILPLLALAAVVVVAVKGDDLLHEKRKVALLGGLGLLYYGMAKNKLV